MTTRPRILFFGYSEVGYDCLSLLLARGDNVVALFTHEDNPSEKIWFKTPAVAAREKGLPIFTPEKITTPEWLERFNEVDRGIACRILDHVEVVPELQIQKNYKSCAAKIPGWHTIKSNKKKRMFIVGFWQGR